MSRSSRPISIANVFSMNVINCTANKELTIPDSNRLASSSKSGTAIELRMKLRIVCLMPFGSAVLMDSSVIPGPDRHEIPFRSSAPNGRHARDDDGLLAKHGKQPQQRDDGPVGGMEPANHLDGRFQMHRIHEVDAHHVGRTPGGAGYLRDRDTRRIGPKTHLAWRHSIQLIIDRLLDMPVLGHVLDDEVT